jgi:hypothetical protein
VLVLYTRGHSVTIKKVDISRGGFLACKMRILSSKRFPTPSVLVMRELMLPMQNEKTTAPITCGHVSQPYRVNIRHHCRVCPAGYSRRATRAPAPRFQGVGGGAAAARTETKTMYMRSPWFTGRMSPKPMVEIEIMAQYSAATYWTCAAPRARELVT